MKKNWKRGGRTYDTDRYESLYHFSEDKFFRSVWPESPFVGPDGYNRSHVDLIIDGYRNRVGYIADPTNPFFEARATLNSGKAKFKP